jgi:hypothetical protein
VIRARRLALASALLVASPAASEPARLDYMLHCQGCHLADGSGKPGAVPALRGFVGRFLEVPGGREFLVRVPGSALSPLSDAELAGVLNWIIRSFGPAHVSQQFTPYSEAEVAGVRRPPLTEVESVREALVLRMEAEPR